MSDPPAERRPCPFVAIERTDVDLDGHTVLHAIDWRLLPGERRGIVGVNGSGKTTLLRLIAGTVWPAPGRGSRRYDFGDGAQTDAVDARTRIVEVGPELQNRYARFGWSFRSIDVVRSGLTRSDIPRRNPTVAQTRAARAILARLGLDNLADQRFLELSRGQQRRVLIARALAFSPMILLLDEPASGLDAAAREELDRLLASIGPETAIVVTAHSPDQLPRVVGEFVMLANGRITTTGHNPAASSARTRPAPAPSRTGTPAAEREREPVPLIEVRNASVFLGERAILRDVCWRLAPGEHWLITGPNGSGKSTFLRLLHGQLRPAVGGSIRWPGLGDPRNVWELRRQIGFVSAELQASYRYRTSVRDCIGSGFDSSLGLTRALSPAEQSRTDELLAAFELAALRERLLTTLSYGQLHRVLLARTLVNRPRVLLLDEPWEGLDPATRALVVRALRNAMAAGTQIVCASHIIEPGLPLNRHARILDGRLSRDDDAGA